MTQLDVYTEDKFEDEQDMRDRTKNLISQGMGSISEPEIEDLVLLTKQQGSLYATLVQITSALHDFVQLDLALSGSSLRLKIHALLIRCSRDIKTDLFASLLKFVEEANKIDSNV